MTWTAFLLVGDGQRRDARSDGCCRIRDSGKICGPLTLIRIFVSILLSSLLLFGLFLGLNSSCAVAADGVGFVLGLERVAAVEASREDCRCLVRQGRLPRKRDSPERVLGSRPGQKRRSGEPSIGPREGAQHGGWVAIPQQSCAHVRRTLVACERSISFANGRC